MMELALSTLSTLYTDPARCTLVPGIYVFTAGVAIMTIMTRTRVLQYRN